jgi:four helix bundle protein
MKSIALEDLEIYKMAMDLGEDIWNLVIKWDVFQKKTIGDQLVRSADSIAANIAEGYGRYHFGEKRQFSFYSRGSLFETKTWLKKAHNRNLITDAEAQDFQGRLLTLGIKLNNYIKTLNNKK